MITDEADGPRIDPNDWPHAHCFVCGESNRQGLKLRFTVSSGGGVAATFRCDRVHEGYEGVVHGGIVSSILDGAMTNCLFAHDVVAWTAELTVRFRRPLAIGMAAGVSAKITRSDAPLYVVEASIVQADVICATAKGKFLQAAPSVTCHAAKAVVAPSAGAAPAALDKTQSACL